MAGAGMLFFRAHIGRDERWGEVVAWLWQGRSKGMTAMAAFMPTSSSLMTDIWVDFFVLSHDMAQKKMPRVMYTCS